ncbi:WD domain, G-beta repeat protein [Aphelenchoides fujianensis]|nr:WD domain, G-beta repeat protein [Aphelenchoides fujianensis]
MNTEFLERNFAVGFPEELDGHLEIANGHAVICKFNRLGTLIAVGSNDGRIFLFDFITRGLIKTWGAHVKPISSLDWSRSGRFLMSASADGTVAIWNVLDTSVNVERYHYGATANPPVAVFNPRNEGQFLVLTLGTPTSNVTCVLLKNIENGEEVKLGNNLCQPGEEAITAISFDHRGLFALLGTAKGRIFMFDTKTMQYVKTVHQGAPNQIRNFLFKNAVDGETLDPLQRFQDMVNKTTWKTVCASNEGDYVCGASAKAHSLHIWERNSGNLIKILHGPKGELLNDAQWHPNRSAHVENWSAFAPDFTELEENRKYEEREHEFDVHDQDADTEEIQAAGAHEEDEIDVVGLQPQDLGSSDEEDQNVKDLVWFLPVNAEATENPEEQIMYQPLH